MTTTKRTPLMTGPFVKKLFFSCVIILLGCSPISACATEVSLPLAFDFRMMVGRFHPVFLHLPIGMLTALFVLELLNLFRPQSNLGEATWWLAWLSLGTGILSIATGLALAQGSDYDAATLFWHQWLGISAGILTALAVLLKGRLRKNATAGPWLAYWINLVLLMGVLALAGHNGGSLTHGSNYLVEYMPSWAAGPRDHSPVVKVAVSGDEYTRKIEPLLKQHCFKCHGSKKSKADLNLETWKTIEDGGESGLPIIVPGKPEESRLIELIMLPTDHKDVMPPEGKKPLTRDEVVTLYDWIKQGAQHPGQKGNALPKASEDEGGAKAPRDQSE